MYNVVFHDWIYLDYAIAYYGEGLYDHESIHFVSIKGEMANRHHELVQLAIF